MSMGIKFGDVRHLSQNFSGVGTPMSPTVVAPIVAYDIMLTSLKPVKPSGRGHSLGRRKAKFVFLFAFRLSSDFGHFCRRSVRRTYRSRVTARPINMR
jgi:hypothetical protein